MPQFIIIAIFCKIIDLYDNTEIYLVYYGTNLAVVFCTQCVARIGAIIAPEDTKLALVLAMMINSGFIVMGNNVIPSKQLHYSIKMLSSISYVKYAFEINMIAIYGFNRCDENQISTVLNSFEVETEKFWPNVIYLIIICCLFKSIVFLILILKTNSSFVRTQSLEKQNINERTDQNNSNSIIKSIL